MVELEYIKIMVGMVGRTGTEINDQNKDRNGTDRWIGLDWKLKLE